MCGSVKQSRGVMSGSGETKLAEGGRDEEIIVLPFSTGDSERTDARTDPGPTNTGGFQTGTVRRGVLIQKPVTWTYVVGIT